MKLTKRLNELSKTQAYDALFSCCGCHNWAAIMVNSRPFTDDIQVHDLAKEIWHSMSKDDYLEAFTHHPQIGADPEKLRQKFGKTSDWSLNEQSGVEQASEETIQALAEANQRYLDKFGYIFIVCASGKSATQMLNIVQHRLANAPLEELQFAAKEQQKITTLRLEKLTL
jgi:2-oxo-4-hydroxy-4-carboxy-5-ureidoimidazoline decarboxylase